MNEIDTTSKGYFRALNILFFALLAGQVLFAVIALFINYTQPIASLDAELQQLLLIIAVVVAVVNIAVSTVIFNAKIKKIKNEPIFETKLASYRSASIIRYALMEMPSLFAAVIFLLSGNFWFLGITAFIILILLFIRPTPEAMAKHLELNYEEIALLQDNNSNVM